MRRCAVPGAEQEQTPVTDRGRRTRAALVAAGRQLFGERGFADVRIDHVAERAGVSHGTFYTWFDSKESLLRAIVAVVVEDVFTATTVGPRLPADAPYARIEAASRLYLRAVTRHARILRVLDSLADTREEFRRLRVDVREAFVRRG